MSSWPLQRDCNEFYGNPRGRNGGASAAWEKNSLVLVKAPWRLVLAWETETPVSGIRVHRKCAESLGRVLAAIWVRFGESEDAIREAGMHLMGGGYNFRLMRGSNALSMHSWGCAVDFDPDRNGLGDHTPAMDRRVIECFEAEGWEWGGHWSRPDGMHFQATHTSAAPKRLSGARDVRPAAGEQAEKPPALDKPSVLDVQRALKAAGFDPGPADGIKGPNTFAAVRRFQQAAGLAVDGMAGPATWKALQAALEQKKAEAKPPAAPVPAAETLAEFEVRAIQQRLRDLALTEVGAVDGKWGTRTTGAVSAFQDWQGLPVTGRYDAATRARMSDPELKPRPVAPERAATTVEELRQRGSTTIKAADRGRGIAGLFALLGFGGGAQHVGLVDGAQAVLDQASSVRPIVDGARDLLGWVGSAWWIAALVGAYLIWRNFGEVIQRRLADQVSGRHM